MATVVVFLTTPGPGTFVIPSTWTAATFETIGGGAGAANGAGGTAYPSGGGGGGYSLTNTAPITPGQSCNYNVGAGGSVGSGNTGGDSWIATNNTASSILSPGVVCGAKGGTTGIAAIPPGNGLGGQALAGIGDVKFSGGTSIGGQNCPAPGAGAAGPFGNGGDSGQSLSGGGGAGGGGGGGGTAGENGAASAGGAGGNNHLGTGGGAAGPGQTDGTNGGGGGGAPASGGNPTQGGAGTEWDATHGSGGGAGAFNGTATAGINGTGGLYGAGSCANNYTSGAVAGAQGLIVITGTFIAGTGEFGMFFGAD